MFFFDRNQDQEKGEESNKIEEWAGLVGIIRESQRGAIYASIKKETAKKRKKRSPVSFQKRRKNNPAISEAMDMRPIT